MAKLNVGVVIARFQTAQLTEAHLRLLEKAEEDSDVLCVLLGHAHLDGHVAEHPLSFRQRRFVVSSEFPNAVVLPLHDMKSDVDWNAQLDYVLTEAFPGASFTFYVGRNSCRSHLPETATVVEIAEVPGVSATDARAEIVESTYTEFLRGQIYAMQKQFPHAYPTVDIACVRAGQDCAWEVLLIKRADTKEWAFPGGFVDPTDVSMESAAKRELYEEVGLTVEGALTYVGSTKITDWRYRGCRDQIMTTFFVTQYSFGPPKVNPEEVDEIEWLPADYVIPPVCDAHVPLWRMMNKALEKF